MSTIVQSTSSYVSDATTDVGGRNKLAKDLDTFLLLLTTQLKNQDPLSPMDTTEFTNQIVQFAQVEQQIAQNEKLAQMVNLNVANLAATAVQYIGHVAEAESTKLPLQDGTAKFAYGLVSEARSVGIMIQDEFGTTVFTQTMGNTPSGVHPFDWDGKDENGVQLPDGTYSISVTALNNDGESIESWTTVFGRVDGVTSVNGTVVLTMGKVGVPMDQILSVTASGQPLNPTQTEEPPSGGGDPDPDEDDDAFFDL